MIMSILYNLLVLYSMIFLCNSSVTCYNLYNAAIVKQTFILVTVKLENLLEILRML